jgi:hypothetical protein
MALAIVLSGCADPATRGQGSTTATEPSPTYGVAEGDRSDDAALCVASLRDRDDLSDLARPLPLPSASTARPGRASPDVRVIGAEGLDPQAGAPGSDVRSVLAILGLAGSASATGACPSRVVVAGADDLGLLVLAAGLAVAEGLALVLVAGDAVAATPPSSTPSVRELAQDLTARGIDEVLLVGTAGDLASWAPLTVTRIAAPALGAASGTGPADLVTLAQVAIAITDRTGVRELVAVEPDDVSGLVHSLIEAGSRLPVLVPAVPEAPQGEGGVDAPGPVEEADAVGRLAAVTPTREVLAPTDPSGSSAPERSEQAQELWLVDTREATVALLAGVAAALRGADLIAIDGSELRAGVATTERMRRGASAAATVVLVGEVADHTAWQLDTVLHGTPLPDGGFLPLEGRRIVALYGSPGALGLGALGQQDLDATVARAREYAEPYGSDGLRVVPGFDMIATIASSQAEPTGDYSRRVPMGSLWPFVERAREEGFAVLLDLQPGRTSFLAQAMEFEELLREPHVHLALDPEWRIGPTEVHLRRIGSVEAAEVQEVVDWLAALVRRELLPQKVLMLHQFTLGMLPDRDTLVIPAELVGVIHVDGFGSQPAKRATYRRMSDPGADQWLWGWKQFVRQDRPLADPLDVIAVDPVPVVITYQ